MRIECFKYTNDDFIPNLPGDKVKVSLLELANGQWRVCVWGGDDLGYELDHIIKANAEGIYFMICMMEFVNIEALEGLGFTRA